MTPKTRNISLAGAGLAAVLTTVAFLATSTGPTLVPAGESLQAYIDKASTGDVLQLAENAVYECNCVDSKGLVIQGPATIRAPSANAAAPTLYYPPKTPPAVLRNVIVSSAIDTTKQVYDVLKYGDPRGTTQDSDDEQPLGLTMENVTITCQPGQECQRGISANGKNFSINNFQILEVHGRGYDTQGICAWNGSGPFKITNGRIEASGENIMFGGALAGIPNLVPSDIEIRRVHFLKPLSWRGVWSVKNLLEFKNARRVVVDGNRFENSWVDAQIGYAVLFTVRGEDGQMPHATLENIQFTNNTITSVAGGFQLLGKDYAGASAQATGLRVANNVIRLSSAMGGNGRMMLMQQYDGVVVENNEGEPIHSFLILTGSDANGPLLNRGLVVRNNLFNSGEYGLYADGGRTFNYYAPDGQFTGNVVYPRTLPLSGNSYLPTKPNPVPQGVGVDYAALQAAQGVGGAIPSPSVTATVTVSPSPVLSPSPISTPESSPLQPSPDKTRIPTAAQIIDDANGVWTLSGNRMLRNGAGTGGFGSALAWCSHRIYGKGEDSGWYQWMGDGWMKVGADPCATASPVPTVTPAPTSSPTPAPSPQPSPVTSPSPLPFCASGERPGNPPRCRCRRGFQGTSGKCR